MTATDVFLDQLREDGDLVNIELTQSGAEQRFLKGRSAGLRRGGS